MKEIDSFMILNIPIEVVTSVIKFLAEELPIVKEYYKELALPDPTKHDWANEYDLCVVYIHSNGAIGFDWMATLENREDYRKTVYDSMDDVYIFELSGEIRSVC